MDKNIKEKEKIGGFTSDPNINKNYKIEKKTLNKISKIIKKCFSSQCGSCRENCPAYIAFQLDSYFSRGKNLAVKAYLDDQLDLEELTDVANACSQCKYCRETCLVGTGAYGYMKDLRALLVKNGIEPKKTKELVKRIIENKTPYNKKDKSWVENMENKGSIGYFPGCTIQAHDPSIAEKSMKLLKKFGIKAVPISNPCCGSTLIRTGYHIEAKKVAEEFCKEINEKNIKKIISSCPGCVSALKNEYPKIIKGIKFKVFHITEILNKNLKNLKSTKKGMKIIYHDPCHLARELGIVKEPRKILESMGCEIIEYEKSGKNSLCCSGGANFALNFPEESNCVANLKIEEAIESGATLIVTACSLCKLILSKAAKGRINVLDILELI